MPRPQERRWQAPKHITLPAIPYMETASSSSEVPFSHIFPATSATRSSLSPSSERDRPSNSFFILNEEVPPIPSHRLSRVPPSPPAVRRPTLPAQISLEHALGDTRAVPQAKRDPGQLAQDQCPPGSPTRTKKELPDLSPIASCNSSRCSPLSGSRSHPQSTVSTPQPKSRPRSRTVASEQWTPDPARWSLDTPSFRSPAAACDTPSFGSSTPRNISISEIPRLSGHIGCAVDIFGLAAVQPPRLSGRPRPRVRQRATEGVLISGPSASSQTAIGGLERGIQKDLVASPRTASPAKG
jgi:hypothetical protein